MAKRFVTVTTPDGTVLKRQTAREYSHTIVVMRKGDLTRVIPAREENVLSLDENQKLVTTKKQVPAKTIQAKRWEASTWIGRPDLVAARVKDYKKTASTQLGKFHENEMNEYYLLETDK